jgi:hypothetical protein
MSTTQYQQLQVEERFDDEEVGCPADANTKAEFMAKDRHTKARPIAADRRRENHLCCGCCCDSRRATIVVNVIVVALFFLLLALFMMNKNDSGDELNLKI